MRKQGTGDDQTPMRRRLLDAQGGAEGETDRDDGGGLVSEEKNEDRKSVCGWRKLCREAQRRSAVSPPGELQTERADKP